MPITQWHPERVRAAVLDELQANAEVVGKFVETEARRRLYAITDPTWGEKYRRLIVGRRLTYVVEREAKAIVVTVGVGTGEEGRHYGFYIETGSRRQPAHPYLRPAVFENARRIVALLAGK